MDQRSILRRIGKACISAGVLILLFGAYQLWGTGMAEANAQSHLRRQFATTSPHPAVTSTTPAVGPTTTAPVLPLPVLPLAPTGSAVAIINIPEIGVNAAVVEGVGVQDLEKGPGHYPNSPMPGQLGNAAIAGHRTTYGAPFYRLDELRPGDPIYISTKDAPRPWVYRVMFSHSVNPDDVAVLDPTRSARLTLTTCTPRFTAEQRLVVVARLVGAVDPHPPRLPVPTSTGAVSFGAPDTVVGSLSGQPASDRPAVAWGLVCAAVWLAAWAIGHRWRRWIVYMIATPVFLACLFIFFENFARFVPANI